VLALAIFDAVLLHVLNSAGPGTWQARPCAADPYPLHPLRPLRELILYAEYMSPALLIRTRPLHPPTAHRTRTVQGSIAAHLFASSFPLWPSMRSSIFFWTSISPVSAGACKDLLRRGGAEMRDTIAARAKPEGRLLAPLVAQS
jgi:hypothetical protein